MFYRLSSGFINFFLRFVGLILAFICLVCYDCHEVSILSEQEIRRILAAKLKEYRERSGLTIQEAGDAIGKSSKTISAWEHGRGQPDADMLFVLCKLYKIESISVFFGMEEKKLALSKEEEMLLHLFRLLNLSGQALAIETLKTFSENPAMQKDGHNSKAV